MMALLRGAAFLAVALCLSGPSFAQSGGPIIPGGGGSGCTTADPTATSATAAVNGSASTCMRSDAAPALGTTTGSGGIVRATSPALVTPTGIVKGDVGLGNVDNTSDATKNAASVTLTNKTISGASNTLSAVATSSLATVQGNGTKVQLSTGTTTTNNCVKYDANGNTVDSGAGCGAGSGVTTITAGTGITLSSGATCTTTCTVNSNPMPKYIANNFYFPFTSSTTATTTAFATTETRYFPIYIATPITLSQLCFRVQTGSAGNAQLSIYANGASNLPTGAPLVTTASMSTTSAAIVCGTASLAVTTPGEYWFATQVDNTSALFLGPSTTIQWASFINGVSASADLWGAATASSPTWTTTGGTFGTWVTNPTVTESTLSTGSAAMPAIAMKLASVP